MRVALTRLASVDAERAREFVKAEPGPLTATDDDTVRLSATLRVHLKDNIPAQCSRRLGVQENTITNRVRTAPRRIASGSDRAPLVRGSVALRLIRLAHDG